MKKEKNVETTKMGPNDVRRVVWVIGMFFFLSFFAFSLLTNIFSTYIGPNLQYTRNKNRKECRDDENGPKRHETRRLGHWYVFSFFLCFFLY